MLDENNTAAQIIRDLALGTAEVSKADDNGAPFIIVPNGTTVQDLENLLPAPLSTRAKVTLQTIKAFIDYVRVFRAGNTAVFVDDQTGTAVAVLDYDEPGRPAFRRHRATFTPRNTVEWARWMAGNDKWLDQRGFAEFIETNVADIRVPVGAEMLEIAATLEAKTAVEFKSGVRLDNGTHRLSFAAETFAKAGDKGTLEIPSQFELAIQPFAGGDAYPLSARFRYKITEGKLLLRYQLVNPHKIIEAAVEEIAAKVLLATDIRPYLGIAP